MHPLHPTLAASPRARLAGRAVRRGGPGRWGAICGAALALGAGCRCPDFSDMDLVDPGRIGSPFDRVHARRAFADFAAWTGEPGMCVPGVELVPELEGGRFLGLYQGPRDRILQVPGAGHTITVHELCHAADERLGWISNDHPELLPVGHIDPVGYPSRYSQEHESFARICEQGPRALDLQQLVSAQCGVALEHPAQRFVLDQVYPRWRGPGPGDGATLGSLALPSRTLVSLLGEVARDPERVLDVASDDRHVWVLTVQAPPAPDPERLGPAVAPGLRSLWAIDPERLAVVGVHHAPWAATAPDGSHRRLALADAVDAPALLVETHLAPDGAATLSTWALGAPGAPPVAQLAAVEGPGLVSGGLRSLHLPAGLLTRVVATAQAPVPMPDAGLDAADEGATEVAGAPSPGTWVLVDPSGGVELGNADSDGILGAVSAPLWGGRVTRLSARAGGAQLTVIDRAPRAGSAAHAARRDWATGAPAAERVDLRRALLRASEGLLPDGAVLGRWADGDGWDGLSGLGGLVVASPEATTWHLPADACDGTGAPLTVRRVLSVGDSAVLWGEGEAGLVLVRVERDG